MPRYKGQQGQIGLSYRLRGKARSGQGTGGRGGKRPEARLLGWTVLMLSKLKVKPPYPGTFGGFVRGLECVAWGADLKEGSEISLLRFC